MAESKEELSLLMKVKEESEEAGLKLNILYGWFMLMFGRNQHNFVKQLSFNLKKYIKKASTFKNLSSWHLVPSLHDKWMGKQWK